MRASSAATGESRWKSDVVASVNALLLDGRVYVSTRRGLVALDGRTGDLLWQASTAGSTVPGFVATDGRQLVTTEQPVGGGNISNLAAFALDDGRTLWRVSFPDNLWSSAAVGHLLIGWGRDGRLVVLG